MAEKYEMGSPQYLAHAKKLIEECIAGASAAELDGVEFSLCEVYTGVPKHIAESGRAAWYFRLRGGELKFGTEEVDDVDFKAIVDYGTIVPLGRLHFGNDPTAEQKAQEGVMRAVAGGKMQRIGDQKKKPAFLDGLHDAMAEVQA